MILTPHCKDRYHTAANQGYLYTAVYAYGDIPARYPVPALADTWTVCALNAPYMFIIPCERFAWDGIWKE